MIVYLLILNKFDIEDREKKIGRKLKYNISIYLFLNILVLHRRICQSQTGKQKERVQYKFDCKYFMLCGYFGHLTWARAPL